MKQHAYKNVNNLKSVDNTSLNFQSRPLTNLGAGQTSARNQDLQQLNSPTGQQGNKAIYIYIWMCYFTF